MKKFICTVCGYVHEGDSAPERCPVCKVPGSKFKEVDESAGLAFADEHVIGVAKGCDEEMIPGKGKDHRVPARGSMDHRRGPASRHDSRQGLDSGAGGAGAE